MLAFATGMGAKPTLVAVSGMAAFVVETLESCLSLGILGFDSLHPRAISLEGPAGDRQVPSFLVSPTALTAPTLAACSLLGHRAEITQVCTGSGGKETWIGAVTTDAN
jgi:hypothetical protein